MRKPIKYAALGIVVLVAIAFIASAVSHHHTKGATGTSVPAASKTHQPKPKAKAPSRPATVGSTLTGSEPGVTFKVKLMKVEDPAPPQNSTEAAPSGQRLIGVEFAITGVKGTYSDDANGAAVVIGTNSQTYQFSFSTIAACTNFNAGDFTVTRGQTAIGCVVFQLPDSVKVRQVQYQAGDGLGNSVLQWSV